MNDLSGMAEAITMIRESAQGLADPSDLARIRRLRYQLPGADRAVWREMCEMGWPALRVAEERGGVGLPMAAYCALAEELGKALVPEPLIGAMLCASLLDGEPLAKLLSGESIILPAWQVERDSCLAGPDITLRDGRLFGRRLNVQSAALADRFLVIGEDCSWLVDADDPGLSLAIVQGQDGGHWATLELSGATGLRFDATSASALAEAALAASAYLLGIIVGAVDRSIAYLDTRKQFGKVIGSFQALQHRIVDLKLQLELTRASVEQAARLWEAEPGSATALAAVSRAKARASKAALLVTRQAIQLHGGIGYTDEHDIGLFLRKAMVLAPLFGSARWHAERFAALVPISMEH